MSMTLDKQIKYDVRLITRVVLSGVLDTRDDRKHKLTCIKFTLYREEKRQRVMGLIDELKIAHSTSYTDKGCVVLRINFCDSREIYSTLCESKEFPIEWLEELTQEQFYQVLDEIRFDCRVKGMNSIQYTSKNTNNIDMLQLLCDKFNVAYTRYDNNTLRIRNKEENNNV